MPMFCVEYTPGACIEPTILKLLWRLQIPYDIYTIFPKFKDGTELIIAGMNGNSSFTSSASRLGKSYKRK